ncbi:MAG TPA: flippase activity-associated protein Agl23 [Chthonomonadaceae bacterium]|nr:flippase activity-associated protein Agl23 [Chthonomonadaceae bacterium]
MRLRRAFLAAMLALTVGALLFRLPALGNRPFHGDEAVHAFKFQELWKEGMYRYDANEYHGPTLYYAALPVAWINWNSSSGSWFEAKQNLADFVEADFRLPIVLFGAAMVLAMAPLAAGLGRRATFSAGILLAISPALVFYSRYYIQETLLAFFTLATISAGWQYARGRRLGWAIAAGVCAGLMIATKETAALAFAAALGAFALMPVWRRFVDRDLAPWTRRFDWRHLALAATVAIVVACLFLSGFGSNHAGPAGILTGPLDYLKSYTPWLRRAGGASSHVYPWSYYFSILLWSKTGRGPVYSEALIVLLGILGAIVALSPRRAAAEPPDGPPTPQRFALSYSGSVPLLRFIAFYTILLSLIYSAIPYKTPWCLLSFLTGAILLAGVGAMALITGLRSVPVRAAIGVLLIGGCAQLMVQAWRASYVAYTDPANPYVYAQPTQEVVSLGKRIADIAHYSGRGPDMLIKVIWPDNYHWPIPWYLREFTRVGYYHDLSDPDATVVIAPPEMEAGLDAKLGKTHVETPAFGVRPGVIAQPWVRNDVWAGYLKMRPRPADD